MESLNDFDLCNRACKAIQKLHQGEYESITKVPDQQTIFLVWHVAGVVENGGFMYLLEHDIFNVDPQLKECVAAFRRIGAEECATALERLNEIIPSDERSAEASTTYYLAQPESDRLALDRMFYAQSNGIEIPLAKFIRGKHLEHLADSTSGFDGPQA